MAEDLELLRMVRAYDAKKKEIACLKHRIHRISQALSIAANAMDDNGRFQHIFKSTMDAIGDANIKIDVTKLAAALSERKRLVGYLKEHGLDSIE